MSAFDLRDVRSGERVWLKTLVAPETTVRVLVTGPITISACEGLRDMVALMLRKMTAVEYSHIQHVEAIEGGHEPT